MHFVLLLVLTGMLFSSSVCAQATFQTVRYKLAARNLPPEKNPFAEIKDTPGKNCRTDTIDKTQNPNWPNTCSVNFVDNNSILKFEIRHHKGNQNDDSMGYVVVYVKNMLKAGQTIREEIWDEKKTYWVGTLLITTQSALVYDVASENQTNIIE